ncbi:MULTISPECIES: hypothetical protein [unclassified Streptomyces]|uniref:hypothetical protein n=1 Tax=Streptomyces sp. NPDC127532 TaxID=3345399 RepID=UPI00362B434A
MRRRRDQARDYLKPADPDIIAITIQEIVALVEVLEHAHVQISKLSNSDSETIINASGSALIPSLYARAGLVTLKGHRSRNVPLLVGEIALLDAAVINLESYEGNEVTLCVGYELLEKFAIRKRNAYPVRPVHGILAFADEIGDMGSRPVNPSLG